MYVIIFVNYTSVKLERKKLGEPRSLTPSAWGLMSRTLLGLVLPPLREDAMPDLSWLAGPAFQIFLTFVSELGACGVSKRDVSVKLYTLTL